MIDRRYKVEGSFDFNYCGACGLLWMDPMPTDEEARKFYEIYFTHDNSRSPERSPEKGMVRPIKDFIRASVLCGYYGYGAARKGLLFRWLGRILRFTPFIGAASTYHLGPLLPHFDTVKGSAVIDVGCGDGQYLEMLQAIGCDVLGIEPDPAACSVLKKKNIPFIEAGMEGARLPENSANLITMRHVIEHLVDPLGTVNECFRVLKPGGRLVVRTPNSASLSHKRFKSSWYPIDTPRHLYLFSPKSMKLFGEKSLFGDCAVRTLATTAGCIYDTSITIAEKGNVYSAPIRPQGGRTWFILKERLLCALGWPCGEEIEAVFTRK